MFYIRADGNEKIGMGHIMRCLSIAQALKEQGEEVTFLIADDQPVKILEEKGFPYHILFTYYDEMNVELPQLVMLLSTGGTQKPRILVDSYYVTKFYLENLRLVATVILMDDMKTEVYPCDALVNYNIYGKTLGYEADYPGTTKLLLGADYVPLRPQFAVLGSRKLKAMGLDGDRTFTNAAEHGSQMTKAEKDSQAELKVETEAPGVRDILVTTGGGDNCHMMLRFAKRLAQADGYDLQYHFVCGPFCPDTEALKELAEECKFVKIHENVTDLSELMLQCQLAVSAAGSTLYELSALGVPTIGFYFVENQRRNMEAFGTTTPIMNAGDFSQKPEEVLDFIQKEIAILCQSPELCRKISVVLQNMIDGQGAKRLAVALLAL